MRRSSLLWRLLRLEQRRRTGAAANPPVNTVAPAISGNVQVGQTLSTTDGTWTGDAVISFTYQWKRAGVNIASATNSTYLLAVADAGQAITCDVTGTNGVGNATAGSNTLTIDVYAVLTAHVEDATDQTTYSGGVWDGVAIGVAAANRIVVVVPDARGAANNTLSVATVGGNATSQRFRVTSDSGGNKIEFRTVALTTGTTANLIFTWSGVQTRSGCGVWAIYGAGSEVPSDTRSSVADPSGTLALAVPAKGIGLGVSFAVQGTLATWTGLTERFDTAIEATVSHSGADINSNAGGTINTTIDWNGVQSTEPVHALAAWGP